MMSHQVNVCEGKFTIRSEMYDCYIYRYNYVIKSEPSNALKCGREGVRFSFIKTYLVVLFAIAYSLFKVGHV